MVRGVSACECALARVLAGMRTCVYVRACEHACVHACVHARDRQTLTLDEQVKRLFASYVVVAFHARFSRGARDRPSYGPWSASDHPAWHPQQDYYSLQNGGPSTTHYMEAPFGAYQTPGVYKLARK